MTQADYARLAAGLRPFIARRVDDGSIDDVLQETLEKIHKGLGRLDDGTRLAPWAYTIARHAIADHHRRAARQAALSQAASDEGAELDDEDEATRIEREVASWLRPMIDALPENDREALTLTELGGMSQAELATHLGIAPSAARSRVQRARRRLRETLEACCVIERDRRGNVIGYVPRDQAVCCD